MQTPIQGIEEIYHRKIFLFKELLNCIALERDNLINQDIESLWSVMEEKEKILESIEDMRNNLKDIMGKEIPYLDMPPEDRQTLKGLSQKIDDLKGEIKVRVKENVAFIQEIVVFFHEMISTLTRGCMPEDSYGPGGNSRKGSPNLIYHNEV